MRLSDAAACPRSLGRRALGVALAMLALPLTARAMEYGSTEEAQAMAEKAAALLREKGLDAALAAFSVNPGPFRYRDLYVFVYRNDGVAMLVAAQPALTGRNLMDMKDVKGTPLVRNFIAVQDKGWVDYYYPNPETKAIQAKSSYVIAVGEYRVGVGAYKTQ